MAQKVQFKISLNEEQKRVKEQILESTLSILIGKAGSGKTLLACQIALSKLLSKEISKIVITRPYVTKETNFGILPGTLNDKMLPLMQPILQNMYMLYDKEKIDQLLEAGIIEIVPVAFMRGRTFTNAICIVDEAQNLTDDQMEMCLTRIGVNCKMIVCGDLCQIDLNRLNDSGLYFISENVDKISGAFMYELQTNNRHAIVEEILNLYKDFHALKTSEKHDAKKMTKKKEKQSIEQTVEEIPGELSSVDNV